MGGSVIKLKTIRFYERCWLESSPIHLLIQNRKDLMQMLSVSKMIDSAQEALGWPYVSPGSNDKNGIDCSGLFVKIYRDQRAKIYHGSNTIYRQYCTSDKGPIVQASQLKPGMAVFKWKEETPAKFNDGLGDFCHIGLVVSGNPLRIIHASSAAGCVTTDTTLGKWKYYGKLKDVNYGSESDVDHDIPDEDPIEDVSFATVYSENGKPVKLRPKPQKGILYDELKVGTVVEVVHRGSEWTQVNYRSRQGWYMMTNFLRFDESYSESPVTGNVLVTIDGLTMDEAQELKKRYPQAEITVG